MNHIEVARLAIVYLPTSLAFPSIMVILTVRDIENKFFLVDSSYFRLSKVDPEFVKPKLNEIATL